MINGNIKSKKTITIMTNNTIRINPWEENRAGDGFLYSCQKSFGNDMYLLKKIANESTYREIFSVVPTYRCMQLIKQSRFVAQWRFGPTSSLPQDCVENFAPIDPWPLVYFPVRKTYSRSEVGKRRDLFQDYIKCPTMGGFLMRVSDEKGNPIIERDQCKNDYPSSRFEMECVDGEGIQITPSEKCRRYTTGDRTSAKLICLANWEDQNYLYSVLMPSTPSTVYSFHCLRMNKTDPTTGSVFLFLDTVCRTGDPHIDDNFLRLYLRRHPVQGICSDLSDQCNPAQCHNMKYWCAKTCNHCPNTSEPLLIDESIRGTWILHNQAYKAEYKITDKTIDLSGLGKFHAYGNLSQARKMCISRNLPLEKDTFEYALAQEGSVEGCGARTTQFRARRVGSSVLLLQAPGTAPLRPDQYMTDPQQWCHNNYRDVELHPSVFTPHWPSTVRSGWFTLINSEQTIPVPCDILDKHQQSLIDHLKMKLEFSESDERYVCEAESHIDGKTYKIGYNCDNGPSGTRTYECLAVYRVGTDYQGVILKWINVDNPTIYNVGGIQTQNVFYCLLVPIDPHKKSLWYYSSVGDCDVVTGSMFHTRDREPLAKMTPIENINCGRKIAIAHLSVLGMLLFYPLFV